MSHSLLYCIQKNYLLQFTIRFNSMVSHPFIIKGISSLDLKLAEKIEKFLPKKIFYKKTSHF